MNHFYFTALKFLYDLKKTRLFIATKSNGNTTTTSPSCTANSMDIGLSHIWDIEINNMR